MVLRISEQFEIARLSIICRPNSLQLFFAFSCFGGFLNSIGKFRQIMFNHRYARTVWAHMAAHSSQNPVIHRPDGFWPIPESVSWEYLHVPQPFHCNRHPAIPDQLPHRGGLGSPCVSLGTKSANAADFIYVALSDITIRRYDVSLSSASLVAASEEIFVNTGHGLNNPTGLAFDSSRNLYAANISGNTINRYSASGAYSGTPFVPSGRG